MNLAKCRLCEEPIAQVSSISDMVQVACDDKTVLKRTSIESVKKGLCKECFDKLEAGEPWWKMAKTWICQECGTKNPMSSDVCSCCECSLDGFVSNDEWEMEVLE